MSEPTPAMRLLRTKLFVPRAHPDLVERPRLIVQLNAGLRCKLTLISAPAGSGKTTLLATWLANARVPVAWLSLDERDNDASKFWAYAIAALQALDHDVGHTALAMLQSPQPPPLETMLADLLNDLALISHDFVLVLDDYHTIDNASIHQGLTFLLDHLPGTMHLVIASRTEPPFPLPLLRVRREAIALSSIDLRFTPEEAAAFLNRVMGLSLSASDLETLETLTEGWIAGLQLAALSMQGMDDVTGFIRSFTGGHRYVFDYLAQEVLNRQPQDVQHFLLQTSILDRLSSSLCDAITRRNDSQSILEQLEQANLFLVPLDQQRHWYRYHHLFADFLHARLMQTAQPGDISHLHQWASAWCEQHDLASETVSHALAAQDVERAMALVRRYASAAFDAGDIQTIVVWLKALPQDRLRADPPLSMIYAWCMLATSQMDDVESHLQDVERALGIFADGPVDLTLPVETRGALSEVLCVRANLAFHQQNLERALELSQKAIAYLADVSMGLFHTRRQFEGVATLNMALAHEFSGNVPAAVEAFTKTIALSRAGNNPTLAQLSASHLAQLQVIQGQLREAAQIYEQSLEANTSHPLVFSGLVHVGQGNLLCEWNELERATLHLTRGIELGRQWNNWETLLPGYLGLARVKAAQGDVDGALAVLDEVTAFGQHSQAPWGVSVIDAHRARLAARRGDLDTAARWAHSAHVADDAPFAQEAEAIIFARVLVALNRHDEALRLAERLLASAEAGQRWGRILELGVIQSLAFHAQGEIERAAAALERVLTLAEPQNYQRLLLDEGEAMQWLIANFRLRIEGQSQSVDRRIIEYADRLLASFPRVATPPSPIGHPRSTTPAQRPGANVSQLVEPLSQRELEVLRCMADGLTNQEIADKLVLSLNTIKTHVKNIHSKLDVRNRTQATARARQLGLL